MKKTVAATFVAVAASALSPAQRSQAVGASGQPVLVELYQSQGCSSCPPAIANVNRIADDPRVVALIFSVTYWDQLGWKDTFAQPTFTARQWDYARFNHRSSVATPQVWVEGRVAIVGSDTRQLAAAIAAAHGTVPAPQLTAGEVAVPAAPAPSGGADLWLVRYDPRSIAVPIKAGENGGKTIAHRDIVRQLVKVGHWSGQAVRFAIPGGANGLATAAFLQAGRGGPILSAAKS